MNIFKLSKKYIFKLIISHEITSKQHYIKRLSKPTVPPLESGVTVGIGLDLGYLTAAQIRSYFGTKLSDVEVNILCNCAGLKGDKARDFLKSNLLLQNINIPFELAEEIFYTHTLPAHCANTLRVYRDVTRLHPIEQTAIVGLVFNRGNDVRDTDRRREMRQLIDAIAKDDDAVIADRIRSMKRLWINKGADGLLVRREDEADAIELPDNIIIYDNDLLRIAV